jgi:hypothetical protein
MKFFGITAVFIFLLFLVVFEVKHTEAWWDGGLSPGNGMKVRF